MNLYPTGNSQFFGTWPTSFTKVQLLLHRFGNMKVAIKFMQQIKLPNGRQVR